jgi:molybdate transport system ATP-binding protein
MIVLQNVRLTLGQFQLEVKSENLGDGITGIFGPSGSGKTTLLEIIAGIRRPHSGFIEMNGSVLSNTGEHVHVPIEHRAIGYVPQDLALFPHLSVKQNLLFGAHGRVADDEFRRIINVLDIDTILSRGIANLSGGEKQRVAFARALLASPRLLMLDEPLSSLDGALKNRMIHYLLHLSEEFKTPMIYVSHEAGEIKQLCSDVLIVENGSIVKRGHPSEVL